MEDILVKTLSYIVLSLSLVSCAWLEKRRALFGEGDLSEASRPSEKGSGEEKLVTKTQYDQLLKKYEDLLSKVNQAEAKSVANNQSLANQIPVDTHAKENQMINELSKIKPNAELAETVDVFGKGGLVDQVNQDKKMQDQASMSDNQIARQLSMLQKANTYVSQNKMDSALILLKELEESPNVQIKVRAKFYLAEMLFRQNEFDLGMQMYEEVIGRYAFSGLVIKSLGRLIVCSEKLKLNKKQEKYYSILHDFFEAS